MLGMEVTNTNIRIWIHDQDLAKLEKVVWEGMGHLLIKHTSAHNKIRKFLEAVPRLLNDIKKVHAASVTGDVDKIADQEFRQKVYLSKDVNGTSAFHKAIVNGHRDMADHLMEKTDRACFNIVDRNGRTGLHYAAALSQYDDIGMYGWLMNMGYDKSQQDYVRFCIILNHFDLFVIFCSMRKLRNTIAAIHRKSTWPNVQLFPKLRASKINLLADTQKL